MTDETWGRFAVSLDDAMDTIRQAYGWTIATDGTVFGLVAGDQGYEPTHIVIPKADMDALEAAAYARGLEDAAKVLDRHDSVPVHPHPEWDEKFSDGYETGQMDAASSWQYAIRALGAKP